MRGPIKNIGGLSHLGCARGQQRRRKNGGRNIVYVIPTTQQVR